MTSARNLLQPLSGNKMQRGLRIVLFGFLLCLFALSSANASDKKRVALILPMNFQIIDANGNLDQKSFDASSIGVDYYRGFKLAIDSLASTGVKFDIKIFDSEGDTNVIKRIALDPFLHTADFVFAPLSYTELQVLSHILHKSNAIIISGMAPQVLDAKAHENVRVANASLEAHAQAMARHTQDVVACKKFMIVRNGLLHETRYSLPFKAALDTTECKVKFTELLVSKQGFGNLTYQLSKTQSNILVIPSGDQTFAINLFKFLEGLTEPYDITLLVHPKWIDFQTIDPSLMIKYHVTITSSNYVNYAEPSVAVFLSHYRATFFTEPTEFSFKGFDQGMFYLSNEFSKRKSPEELVYTGLSNRYSNSALQPFEVNEGLFIIQFQENGLVLLK